LIVAPQQGTLHDDVSTCPDDPAREGTATARSVDSDPRNSPLSRVLHRTLFADPVLATRGDGIYLHTADGRTIIDGSGGAAVACLGHGHPRINAAIAEQLAKVAYGGLRCTQLTSPTVRDELSARNSRVGSAVRATPDVTASTAR
jgi:4-aminobutyrate aminotransferase-like enzyme